MQEPEMLEGLSVLANVIVVVILPVTLFLVRHITGLRKDIQVEIERLATRIESAEKDHLRFQAVVARTYMSQAGADRLLGQQAELMETKFNGLVKGMDRIESWLSKVSDTAGYGRRADD